MKELKHIQKIIFEYEYLKKRSELLDIILNYWDKESMTFEIPEKYGQRYQWPEEQRKQIPKTPRHFIMKKMTELLPYSDHATLINWEESNKTLDDK